MRDKEGRVKKFEHGRSSGGGRGGYAPARRDRAPFPSQRLNVDVSPRHYFFPFPFFSFLFVPPPPPPSSWKSLAALTQSYAICVVRGKSDPSQERRPSKKRSPLSVPPLLSLFPTLPLIAVLPRLTSQILRFFPRVTRFRSQNPIPRLNIYCPLRLINDTFLHPATS